MSRCYIKQRIQLCPRPAIGKVFGLLGDVGVTQAANLLHLNESAAVVDGMEPVGFHGFFPSFSLRFSDMRIALAWAADFTTGPVFEPE